MILTILSFILPALMTTLGSVLVFFFKKQSKIANLLTIGIAAGIMLSASIWSLLIPALEQAQQTLENLAFLPIIFGFVFGCLFMVLLDFICKQIFNKNSKKQQKNQQKTDFNHQKAFKLFTAITVHNIPEGMSVGFAVGTAITMGSSILTAFLFALGIALQNLPEGLATALPIYSCIHKKGRSFLLGTMSGLVEPLFALIGFFLSAFVSSLLPWLLTFSAGAMIYVIVEELIPELQMDGKSILGTWSFITGFVIMMLLDICL